MTTIWDVPAQPVLEVIKESLKANEKFKQPEWALFVKTGMQC